MKLMKVSKATGGYLRWAPRMFRRWRRGNVNGGERIVSALVGLGLMLYGLRRRSAAGIASAVAGGMLAERGMTGRCPVYGALGVSSS